MKNYKILYKEPFLSHHGILGQKWGDRNGPPYPLGSGSHSSREKKAGWRKSLSGGGSGKSKKSNKSRKARNKSSLKDDFKSEFKKALEGEKSANKTVEKFSNRKVKDPEPIKSTKDLDIQNILGLNDEEYAKAKKYAKIAGITLATTAGIVAAGYLINKYKTGLDAKTFLNEVNSVNDITRKLQPGYNTASEYKYSLDLGRALLDNKAANGDYIGARAIHNGYSNIKPSDIINAIKNPVDTYRDAGDYESLIRNVRLNQVDGYFDSGNATRRLSCWSTAHAYFTSVLTGGDFVSKNYQNLANFNDFGKLYNEAPSIFDVFGNKANDFVGNFGRTSSARGSEETAKTLVKSILTNINSSNNLTPDGNYTVGFIDAAYRGCTCTHQWNFQIMHLLKAGAKELTIVDGYSGQAYSVGTIFSNGKLDLHPSGMDLLTEELRHYNEDSIRFYAPSLESLNPEMMAQIILGKK